MKVSTMFPSKYLAAADIKGREVKATIERLEIEQMGDGEHKPVVYFVKGSKGVVLNKTNADTLAEGYGDDSDEWVEKPVVLFTVKTKNPAGQTVDGIRMRVPVSATRSDRLPPAPRAPVDTAHTENHGADMDDEIPF